MRGKTAGRKNKNKERNGKDEIGKRRERGVEKERGREGK